MIKAIAIDDEPLALKVITSLCDKNDSITLEMTFTKPTEAIKYLEEHSIDLVFLDIHMPTISGINLVNKLPKGIAVIFTTAFSEYGAKGFDLNAVDYILKPISEKRFTQSIIKAKEFIDYSNQKDAQKVIFIRADYQLVKVTIADIEYIEGLADYLKIHFKNRKTIISRMTMIAMINELPADEFIRIHRSYIIPFNKITAFNGVSIKIGKEELPIGKTYKKIIQEKLSTLDF